MYGLPKGFSGNFLIGQSVMEVCFTQSHAAVYFDGHNAITIEGSFSFYHSDSHKEKRIIDFEAPIAESDLMKLLGCQVTEVHGDDEGTLSIKFNNGYILECYDCPQYESYFITQGKNTIIV